MSNENPVLIVGAGPVGLTMALELTRHGVPVRIVDKAATRSQWSKALVVWSRTLELLEPSGMSPRLVGAGMPVLHSNIFMGQRRVVRLPLDLMDSRYGYALMLPQSDTERLLEERLAEDDVRVERSTELIRLAQDIDGVTVWLRRPDGTEETQRTRWLLACDGAHSTVRHLLHLGYGGDTEPSDWIAADVRLTGPGVIAGEMCIYWTDAGALGFLPITGDRSRVIADLGPAQGGGRRRDPTLAEVQALIEARGPAGIVASHPEWLTSFRINARKVDTYRHGRILLAGDSAHIHSPAGGQGMNTGMQDAINLAWKLALVIRGNAGDVLLDSYSAERNAVGKAVLAQAGQLTSLAIARDPLRLIVRHFGLKLLGSSERLMQRLTRRFGGIDIAYPDSALSRRGAGAPQGRRVLAAGDRCAELKLTGAESVGTGLLALTAHRGLTLLAVSGRDSLDRGELDAVRGRFRDRFGELVRFVVVQSSTTPEAIGPDIWRATAGTEAYGGPAGGLFVLRPDRYVGLVARRGDWDAAEAYIATILSRASDDVPRRQGAPALAATAQ